MSTEDQEALICELASIPVERRGALLRFAAAQSIAPDSWVATDQRAEIADFRAGHGYASTQTHAISALSKCTPAEMYAAWSMINRGIALHHGISPRGIDEPLRVPITEQVWQDEPVDVENLEEAPFPPSSSPTRNGEPDA